MADEKNQADICSEYEVLQKRAKDITGLNFSTFNKEFAFNFVASDGLTVLKDLNEVATFLRGYEKAKEVQKKLIKSLKEEIEILHAEIETLRTAQNSS